MECAWETRFIDWTRCNRIIRYNIIHHTPKIVNSRRFYVRAAARKKVMARRPRIYGQRFGLHFGPKLYTCSCTGRVPHRDRLLAVRSCTRCFLRDCRVPPCTRCPRVLRRILLHGIYFSPFFFTSLFSPALYRLVP